MCLAISFSVIIHLRKKPPAVWICFAIFAPLRLCEKQGNLAQTEILRAVSRKGAKIAKEGQIDTLLRFCEGRANIALQIHRSNSDTDMVLICYHIGLNVANGPFCFNVFVWEIIETNEFVGI